MKYLPILILLCAGLASCTKSPNRNNPSRSRMLGNYHFYYDSTTYYDGFIKIADPDDGNSVIMSYMPNEVTFSTTDSTLISTDTYCPGSGSSIVAYYRHDSIFVTDNIYVCNRAGRAIHTVGFKY